MGSQVRVDPREGPRVVCLTNGAESEVDQMLSREQKQSGRTASKQIVDSPTEEPQLPKAGQVFEVEKQIGGQDPPAMRPEQSGQIAGLGGSLRVFLWNGDSRNEDGWR